MHNFYALHFQAGWAKYIQILPAEVFCPAHEGDFLIHIQYVFYVKV